MKSGKGKDKGEYDKGKDKGKEKGVEKGKDKGKDDKGNPQEPDPEPVDTSREGSPAGAANREESYFSRRARETGRDYESFRCRRRNFPRRSNSRGYSESDSDAGSPPWNVTRGRFVR